MLVYPTGYFNSDCLHIELKYAVTIWSNCESNFPRENVSLNPVVYPGELAGVGRQEVRPKI